jgi:hypothetical protein
MINSSIRIVLKDKADKISRSESKKFDRENRKAESTAKCWTLERHETEKIAGKRMQMGNHEQKRNRKRR